MEPVRLNRAALQRLPPGVQGPGYDAAELTAGIVHLGFGGFHRAHMARYTHDLMVVHPAARQWGIVGTGLLPADRALHAVLAAQDGLYTLVERSDATERVTVIGSVRGTLFAAEDSAPLLAAIDAARIVSLTVTENGYCLNPASKRLDRDHPAIVADLENPAAPHSAIGILVEGYRRRMVAGRKPFTALSCDNIPHNGVVLKQAVLDFARARAPALAEWLGAEARFPSTMVDRITPSTRPEDVADLAARHGIVDAWPVFCEPFKQWVIEDDFADGRPHWERVGAQFVPDVAPYEFMKLRLLNASHLAIAGLGELAGYRFIHETVREPRLRRYMQALMDNETGPTLPLVPGVDLAAYKATLLERFGNATLMDTVARVNADAPVNLLVDPIRERLKTNGSIELLALALAAWLRRARGFDDDGQPIAVVHPLAAQLRAKAEEGGSDPRPLLGIDSLFGEVGRDERVIAAVGRWLESLTSVGAMQTLRKLDAGR
jgi:mannitol-1-phosphate/altronate dehydrogenase